MKKWLLVALKVWVILIVIGAVTGGIVYLALKPGADHALEAAEALLKEWQTNGHLNAAGMTPDMTFSAGETAAGFESRMGSLIDWSLAGWEREMSANQNVVTVDYDIETENFKETTLRITLAPDDGDSWRVVSVINPSPGA